MISDEDGIGIKKNSLFVFQSEDIFKMNQKQQIITVLRFMTTNLQPLSVSLMPCINIHATLLINRCSNICTLHNVCGPGVAFATALMIVGDLRCTITARRNTIEQCSNHQRLGISSHASSTYLYTFFAPFLVANFLLLLESIPQRLPTGKTVKI